MLHFGVSRSVYLDPGAMLGSGLGIRVEGLGIRVEVWVLLDTKPPTNLHGLLWIGCIGEKDRPRKKDI